MRIPKHWAEARIQRRESGRQVTVRRFGWSDESPEDAQRHADDRALEAFKEAWTGRDILRREPKVPYNGAEGVPIREEIVAQHGSTIITRNSYGALCLNTPDVLFADIDYPTDPFTVPGCLFSLVAAAAAIATCIAFGVWWLGIFAGPALLLLAFWASYQIRKAWWRVRGGVEKIAMRRVEKLANRHNHWQLRVYKTPAGLRVLAMHDVYDPTGKDANKFFTALKSDPIYVTMCRRQSCFRARVSPKPWRINLPGHIKPRPGVWPINEERMPERLAWIAEYESASQGYAACEYVTTLGAGPTHPQAREVQELHDRLCKAESGLAIA